MTLSRRLTLTLLLLAATISAQTTAPLPGPSVVTGVITTVTGNIVTILNGRVAIDVSGAQIGGRQGNLSAADLRPGMRIQATVKNPEAPAGTLIQAGGVIVLDPAEGTLVGPITNVNVNAGTITVAATNVRVTANTKIGGTRSEKSIADLRPGDLATVDVAVTNDGLVAESIRVVSAIPLLPRPVSVSGSVREMNADSWVITSNGRDTVVLINSDTKIDKSIKVGHAVLVLGYYNDQNQIVASAITSTRLPSLPVIATITGVVRSMSATEWMVDDTRVTVNERTVIKRSIAVGDRVRVTGTRNDNGFTAVFIEKL